MPAAWKNGRPPGRSAGLILGLCLLSFGVTPARAQLYALSHDVSGASTELVAVDPDSGVVTPLPSALGAIEIAVDAVANDPFSAQIYALGPDPVAADGSLQLLKFDIATGTGQVVGNTGSFERVVALHFERPSQRLIAALAGAAGGVLRLVTIDTGSAALTQIHSGLPDCCVLAPGSSAPSAGYLYFTGRLRTDASSMIRLIGLSTAGDNATTTPVITDTLGALASDPITGQLYALSQSVAVFVANLQLVAVDGASGTLTPIGAAQAGCCALALDVAAIESGTLRAVGRAQTSSDLSLLSFDLSNGVLTSSTSPLPVTRVFDALFDRLKGLQPSTTTITAIAPNPVQIGSNFLVSVTVDAGSPPIGTVSVEDGLGNQCSFAAPSGSCALPAVALGSQAVTATFASSGTFAGSSDSSSVQVIQATSTTSIISIVPSPATVGANYAVNVSVTGFGPPTGTINVDDGLGGGCVIAAPSGSCNLSSAATGGRTITANYLGDSNNLPSTDSTPQQVLAALSTTSIVSALPGPSLVGQAYTVTISVIGFGAPTGTVSVDDGSGSNCLITLPATTCPLTSMVAGNKTLTASYSGDSNNSPSAGTAAHQVDRAVSTTLIESIVPTPATAGQAVTVTVSVSGFGVLAGTIAVDNGFGDSCVIALPVTSCGLTSNVAGALTVIAGYSGDINNLPSSANTALTVNPAVTTLVLAASANPVALGANEQFTATVSNGANPVTGTIDFSADGNPIAGCTAVPVASSQAVCSTSFNQIGVFDIQADYSGDANNLAASVNLSLSVLALPVPALSFWGWLALILGLGGVLVSVSRRTG